MERCHPRLQSTLPMRPVITTRYNGAVAVERGPLVYSLRIGEQWQRINADTPHRGTAARRLRVRPNTPWNYGLMSGSRASSRQRPEFTEQPVGASRFRPGEPA